MRKVLFIFGEMNDLDIDWLIAHGARQQLAKDAVLIHEGKTVSSLYIVLDGLFSVTVSALAGEELSKLGSGEVIGEISFVDSRPPSATVRAVLNSVVLALPRTVLLNKLKHDTGFAARFYRAVAVMMAHRMRKLTLHKIGTSVDDESPDELDTGVLDNVHLAGARFERMVKRVLPGGKA